VDVEGDVLIERVAGAEERRDRGTLVVGRAAPAVLVALADEVEGFGVPVGALGRLHVEMVVDGHRRIVRAAVEAAVDQGMALRLVQLRLRSGRLEERDGVLGGAADVGLAPRFDRHRRDLDDFLEDAFELRALAARV